MELEMESYHQHISAALTVWDVHAFVILVPQFDVLEQKSRGKRLGK
jgi:hypothetical protein